MNRVPEYLPVFKELYHVSCMVKSHRKQLIYYGLLFFPFVCRPSAVSLTCCCVDAMVVFRSVSYKYSFVSPMCFLPSRCILIPSNQCFHAFMSSSFKIQREQRDGQLFMATVYSEKPVPRFSCENVLRDSKFFLDFIHR